MNDTGKHHNLPPVILRRPSSSTVFNCRRQQGLSSPHGDSVSHMNPYNVNETTSSRSQQNGAPIEEVNLNTAESITCNSEYVHLGPCEQGNTKSQLSLEISTPVTESATSAKKFNDTVLPTCLHVQTHQGLSVGNEIAACFIAKEGGLHEGNIQQSASFPTAAPESTTPVLHSNNDVLSSSEVTSTEICHSTPVFHIVQPQFYLNVKQTNAECDLAITNLSVGIPISDVPPTLQAVGVVSLTAKTQPQGTNGEPVSDLPVLQKCGNDEPAKVTQSEEVCDNALACVNLLEKAEVPTDETVTSTQPEEISNVFAQPQIVEAFSLSNIPEKTDTSTQYQCPKCLKRFDRILSQLEHKCSAQRPVIGSLHKLHCVMLYKCLECLEEFSDLEKKKSHACSSQLGAKSKIIDGASSINAKKKAVKNWCRTPAGSFVCNICKKVALKESEMRVHSERRHSDRAKLNARNEKSKKTKETTSNSKSKEMKVKSSSSHFPIEEHTGTPNPNHNFEHPFKCGLCSMRYKRVAYLKKHVALHMGSDQFKRSKRPYVCRLCKFRFHDSSTLRVHSMKKCTQTRNDRKQDQQNKSSSSRNEDMHIHVSKQTSCIVPRKPAANTTSEDSSSSLHNDKHFPRRKHRCGFCGILCESATSLKKHVRTHWNQVFENYSRPLECCLCNEQFANCVRFFLHVRRNSCSSTATEDTSQSSAIELSDGDEVEGAPVVNQSGSAHRKEQPHSKGMHQCQFCNLNFWSSDILAIHLHSSHPFLHQTEETATSNSSESEVERNLNNKNKDQGTPDPVLLNQQSEVKASNEAMQTQTHRSHDTSSVNRASRIQVDQCVSPPTDNSSKELSVRKSNDSTDHTFSQDCSEKEEDTEVSQRTQIYPSQCKICKITLSSWKRFDTHCRSHHAEHLNKHLHAGQSQPYSSLESRDSTNIDVIKVKLFHSCKFCERVFKYWKSLVFHQKLKHDVRANCAILPSRRQERKVQDKQCVVGKPRLELNNAILDSAMSSLSNEIRCKSTQELTTTHTLAGNSHDSNNLAGLQNEIAPSRQEYENCNPNQSQPSKKDNTLSSSTDKISCESTAPLFPTQILASNGHDSNNLAGLQNEIAPSRQEYENCNQNQSQSSQKDSILSSLMDVSPESIQKLTPTQTLAGNNSHASNNLGGLQNKNAPSRQEYESCNQNQSQSSQKDHSLELRRTVEDLQIASVVSLKTGESFNLWNSVSSCSSVKKGNPQHITGRTPPLFDEASSNRQVETRLESQRLECTQPKETIAPDMLLHSSFNNKRRISSSKCAGAADVQQAILDELTFLMNSVVTLQSTLNDNSSISAAAGVLPLDQLEWDGTTKKIPFSEVKLILKSLERNCCTNAYHCSVCREMLNDIPQYTSHILAHCELEQFTCVFCGLSSQDIFSVLNHAVLTHRVDEINLTLEPQDNRKVGVNTPPSTSTSDVLDTPVGQPSTDASPLVCETSQDYCTYPRPRYDYIFKPNNPELDISQDEKTGQFACPACLLKYMDKADVIYHLRMYHNGQPYICKHCPEKFCFYPDIQVHFFKDHFLHVTQHGQHVENTSSALGGQCSQQTKEITTLQPSCQSLAAAGLCHSDLDVSRKRKSCNETTSDESEVNTGCCGTVESSSPFIHHIHKETTKQTGANSNPEEDGRTGTQELDISTLDAPAVIVVKQEKPSEDVFDEYTYGNTHHHLKGQITIKTEKLDDSIYPSTECMQPSNIGDEILQQSEIEHDGEIDSENDLQTRIVPRDQHNTPESAASCSISDRGTPVKVCQSENDLLIFARKVKVEKDVSQLDLCMEKEIGNEVEVSNAKISDSTNNDAVVNSSVRSEATIDISAKTNSLDSTKSNGDDSHVESSNLSHVDDRLDDVEDVLKIANELGITLTESLPELQSSCSKKGNPGDYVESSNRMITSSTETSGPKQTDKSLSPPGRLQENERLISDEYRELASPHTLCDVTPQDHKECQSKNPLDSIKPNPFHQNESISEILKDIAKNSFTSRILASFEEDSRASEVTNLHHSPDSSKSDRALTVSTSSGTKRHLEPSKIPQQITSKKLRASDGNRKDMQAAVAEDRDEVCGITSTYNLTLDDANEVLFRLHVADFNKGVGTKGCDKSHRNSENHGSLSALPENILQDSLRGVTRPPQVNVSAQQSNYEQEFIQAMVRPSEVIASARQSNYEHYLSNMEAPVIHKRNCKPAANVLVNKSQNLKQQSDKARNVRLTNQMSKRDRHCSGGQPLFRYHQVPSLESPGNCYRPIDQLNNSNLMHGQYQDDQTLCPGSINVLEPQQRSNQSNVTLPQHLTQVQMDIAGYQQNHRVVNSNQQNSCGLFEMQTQTPWNGSQIHGQFAVPPRQHKSRCSTLKHLLGTPKTVNFSFSGNNPPLSADSDRLPDHSNYLLNGNNVAFNNYTGPSDSFANNMNLSYEQSYSDVQRRNFYLQSTPNGIPLLPNNDYLRPVATMCGQLGESVDWDNQLPQHPSYPQPLGRNNLLMVSPRDKDERESMPQIVNVFSLFPDYSNK